MRDYSRYLRKEARTMRPNQLLLQWRKTQQSNQQLKQNIAKATQNLNADPIAFFEDILHIKPYEYQKEFAKIFQNNQFTAARWCRQSGKTHTICALLLWHAVTHPNNAIGIVGPSYRQTKRIISKISSFTHNLPPGTATKPQRTQIHFANGSSIEAFPNNPETIRGPTLDVVYCLPAGVKVRLANGSQIPIEQLKPGQIVLSYNLKTGKTESKRILRTFKNPRARRRSMKISHSFGTLNCTAEHKIYSLGRGFVDASKLLPKDKILYLSDVTTFKTGERDKIPSSVPKSQKTFVSKEVQNEEEIVSMFFEVAKSTVYGVSNQNSVREDQTYVYDIEVEDNHNFFAEGVLVSNCDEMNFVANDQELYDAILYTLGTTDGKFVCSSTPWHTDSVFYKIFNHKDFCDFKTSHISVTKALSPNGPLKTNIIERIKTQMGDDPSRWRREMEAEWAEDDDVWLNQSLITSCIGTQSNCGEELHMLDPEVEHRGEFFAGLDLAQTRDYCVLSVVERKNEQLLLRHLKIFQQPTIYASVLSYIKALQGHWGDFERIRVDFTREGPSFIADMERADIKNAEGVNFSIPRKSEMAGLLKQRMLNKQFYYPLHTWERPYRGEICNELNVERFALRKDGSIGYYHPLGTHDDVFWSITLAVYATANMAPEPFLAVVPR